jgi:hypothetical protein
MSCADDAIFIHEYSPGLCSPLTPVRPQKFGRGGEPAADKGGRKKPAHDAATGEFYTITRADTCSLRRFASCTRLPQEG